MRDEEFDARVPRDRAVEDQVDHRPSGVEEELQHRPGATERSLLPTRRRRRVDEQPGAAPVELVEDRLEGRIAQVGPADVREQGEAGHRQLVAAIGDLGDRRIDVGQRQRSEQAEPSGMIDDGPLARLVHFAGAILRRRRVAEVHPGRGNGEQRRRNAEPIHRGHVLFAGPGRDLGEAVGLGVPVVDQGGPVGLWEVVRVHVDGSTSAHSSMLFTQSSSVST